MSVHSRAKNDGEDTPNGNLGHNMLAGNSPAEAMFTFTALAVSLGNASLKDIKYLRQATYDISDLDDELIGFDYDNPVTDPFDGALLNNTLIMNGAAVPAGTKITP